MASRSGDNDQLVGSLGLLEITPGEGENPAVVRLRQSRGGPAIEVEPYAAAEEQTIENNPHFVLQLDGATSRGVLADQMGAFGKYLLEIRDLKQLVDSTIEIQGRLEQALGTIASLEQV